MPAVFDQTTIFRIQQATDIVDVIAEHVSLKKKGREMLGLCPFHDDHRPSLYVNPEKQIFKCFACSAGGDVFKFLQMRENLTFPQAVERLAERAGIRLERRSTRAEGPKTGPEAPGAPVPADIDPNRLAKLNAWAADHFHANLKHPEKGKSARRYLAGRKITPESIEKWRLGLALSDPDDLLNAAKSRKIPLSLLEHAGLITAQHQDKFTNRLMFTIADATARIIGFGGRTLDATGAKYINSPATVLFDKSNSLYGLDHARHTIVSFGTAVVVEGYTDVIAAHQVGCSNVVATLGTSFTPGHARILRRYAKKVVLVFDSDVAGTEAANRALEVCLNQRIDIKLASVPEGKDPCDFLLSAGKEPFDRLIEAAVDVFRYKWDRLLAGLQADDTLAGKKAAIDEYLQAVAVSLVAGGLSPIEKGLRINQISAIIGLDKKQLEAEIAKRVTRARRTASYNIANQQVRTIDWGRGLAAAAQREILEVLLSRPDLLESVKHEISLDIFDVPLLKRIAAVLLETFDSADELSLRNILARAESVDLGGPLVEMARAGEEKGKFESRLTAALETVERCRAKARAAPISEITDQNEFLQRLHEKAAKPDPHNLGMV
jgi:DNA primase